MRITIKNVMRRVDFLLGLHSYIMILVITEEILFLKLLN